MNGFTRVVSAVTGGREAKGVAPGGDRVGRGMQPPQARDRADDDAACERRRPSIMQQRAEVSIDDRDFGLAPWLITVSAQDLEWRTSCWRSGSQPSGVG